MDVSEAADPVRVEREYAGDYDEALQVAADVDVVYGDGTAGPARLVRDPYEVLADRRVDQSAATGPGPSSLTRAQVADALWEGRMSPREAGAVFPDMLDTALVWGVDLDQRVNLDVHQAAADEDADEDAADDGDGWGW